MVSLPGLRSRRILGKLCAISQWGSGEFCNTSLRRSVLCRHSVNVLGRDFVSRLGGLQKPPIRQPEPNRNPRRDYASSGQEFAGYSASQGPSGT